MAAMPRPIAVMAVLDFLSAPKVAGSRCFRSVSRLEKPAFISIVAAPQLHVAAIGGDDVAERGIAAEDVARGRARAHFLAPDHAVGPGKFLLGRQLLCFFVWHN